MLTTYFKRQTTLATYYAGPAGSYLDGFTDWLAQRGYRLENMAPGQDSCKSGHEKQLTH